MRRGRGAASLAVRFAYGLRLPVPIACGAAPVKLPLYVIASGISCWIWSWLFVYVGWKAGGAALAMLGFTTRWEVRIGFLLIVLLGLYSGRFAVRTGLPRQRFSWAELGSALRESAWEVPLPFLVVGGIYGADIDELFVKSIYVEQGTTLKRFAARAKGRGNRIVNNTKTNAYDGGRGAGLYLPSAGGGTIAGRRTVSFRFAQVPLLDGTYALTFGVHTRGGLNYDQWEARRHFEVAAPGRDVGLVRLPVDVVVNREEEARPGG